MINITKKSSTLRYAKAEGFLNLKPKTVELIRQGKVRKGDIHTAAKLAGIEGAKRTPECVIFTHTIPIDGVTVETELSNDKLKITSEVHTVWKTGVEVEAITSVTIALLNVLDMLKPHDPDITMTDIRVVKKKGGRNDFREAFEKPPKAAVLVISDSTYAGDREDKSGKVISKILEELDVEQEVYDILPDDKQKIYDRVAELIAEDFHLIITTGGTGFGPKDVTPEAVKPLIRKEAPGIAEQMRSYGTNRTPYAMLSREVAGINGNSLILTLPGSSKGAEESMRALFPGVMHIFPMLWGGKHEQPKGN